MLSPEQNFHLSIKALSDILDIEISCLRKVAGQPYYNEYFENVKDCENILAKSAISGPLSSLCSMSRKDRIIYFHKAPLEIKGSFYMAQMVAILILLEDMKLSISELIDLPTRKDVEMYLSRIKDDQNKKSEIMQRLSGSDAVRVGFALRALGLISRSSQNISQLGLGSASGLKDMRFFHMHVDHVINKDVNRAYFKSVYKKIEHIIVNDLDPRHSDLYRAYELRGDPPTKGYICSADDAVNRIYKDNLQKRNLITMLRIEPAMMSNSARFLLSLSNIIDKDCDFVMTMGSGDNPAAYKKRVTIMRDMFDRLDMMDLHPVLIKLHKDGSTIRQGRSLQIGSGPVASYEILYCRLKPEVLADLRNKS